MNLNLAMNSLATYHYQQITIQGYHNNNQHVIILNNRNRTITHGNINSHQDP
jgi:hypothetical protein